MNTSIRKLDAKIGNVIDPETNALVRELTQVVGVRWEEHLSLTLFQFLQLCHHPGGGLSKFRRIKLKEVMEFETDEKFVLRMNVGKCGNFLYGVCRELVPGTSHIDNFSGEKLCVFLGKMFDPKCGRDRGRYSI